MSSRSASTGGSTRSTPSARCSASRAGLRRRPTPTFIPARGRTLHVAGVCINRIGKVSSTGQAAAISISASIDNQIEYSDVNSLRINTQDDEIASWVARDLSGKFINGKWSLSDSLTPCYDHARQATKENDILYCVTIDILNYVLNDHSRIDKDTALQSIKKRADATLSALGRPNESEDAVSHAMLISNIVLDTIVAQQSHSEAGLTPQSPLAAPPASNPASDRTPPATASAPAAAPVPAERSPPAPTFLAPQNGSPAGAASPAPPPATASNSSKGAYVPPVAPVRDADARLDMRAASAAVSLRRPQAANVAPESQPQSDSTPPPTAAPPPSSPASDGGSPATVLNPPAGASAAAVPVETPPRSAPKRPCARRTESFIARAWPSMRLLSVGFGSSPAASNPRCESPQPVCAE